MTRRLTSVICVCFRPERFQNEYIDDSVEAQSLLMPLEVNKDICADSISAKLLQTAAPGTRSHTVLFSHSLDTGMVPCEWMSPLFALYQRVIAVKR